MKFYWTDTVSYWSDDGRQCQNVSRMQITWWNECITHRESKGPGQERTCQRFRNSQIRFFIILHLFYLPRTINDGSRGLSPLPSVVTRLRWRRLVYEWVSVSVVRCGEVTCAKRRQKTRQLKNKFTSLDWPCSFLTKGTSPIG